MSIKIINGLTDTLRDDQKGANHNLTVRVCQFVDKITHEWDSVWSFSKYEKDGEITDVLLEWTGC